MGLAVDGSASNDGSNLLEELRVAYLLHRLQSSEKAPSGYDVLKIATVGSAKILGRDDIGSLEVGKAGDLFAIDTRRLELVGADLDPKSLLGTVGWKGPVDYTVVNGKVTVRSGKLVNLKSGLSHPASERAIWQFIRKMSSMPHGFSVRLVYWCGPSAPQELLRFPDRGRLRRIGRISGRLRRFYSRRRGRKKFKKRTLKPSQLFKLYFFYPVCLTEYRQYAQSDRCTCY